MNTISQDTFTFLSDLEQNNNREWFLENKPRFETAKKKFEFFVDELIIKISKFDGSIGHHAAKECIFRIRNIRFSKDKYFGAHITAATIKSVSFSELST